jgi:hypothetical protein
VREWRSWPKNSLRRLFEAMQTPFVAFLLGENEKKIRQGVAVAGSPSIATATVLKSITIFALVNALVACISIYVQTSLVLLFESSVIVASLINYIKSLYALNNTMMEINIRRQFRKERVI